MRRCPHCIVWGHLSRFWRLVANVGKTLIDFKRLLNLAISSYRFEVVLLLCVPGHLSSGILGACLLQWNP